MGGTGGLRMRESGLVREAGGDSSPTVSLTRDTARTGPVRPHSEGRGRDTEETTRRKYLDFSRIIYIKTASEAWE